MLVNKLYGSLLLLLGAVHKGRSQSGGEGGLPNADVFRTSGRGQAGESSSDVDVRTFWCKKTSDFLKFIVYPQGQGGFNQCGLLPTRGEGVNFSQFCVDVFYGRHLTKFSRSSNLFEKPGITISSSRNKTL